MHQGREASTETSGHLVLQGLDDPGLKILLFLPHVTIFSIRVEFVQVVGILLSTVGGAVSSHTLTPGCFVQNQED